MAITWSGPFSGSGNNAIKIGVEPFIENQSENLSKVRLKFYAWTKYAVNDSSNVFCLILNGTNYYYNGSFHVNTKNNSGSGWSQSNIVTICDGTTTDWTRYESARALSVTASSKDVATVGNATLSFNVYLDAKTRRYVTYYPNGGSPNKTFTDSAFYASDYVVRDGSTYSRQGYTFKYWSADNGETWYAGKRRYNRASNTALTAAWNPRTYTLSYSGNYPNCASPINQNIVFDTSYTISGCGFKRPGYTFQYWQDDSQVKFNPGENHIWKNVGNKTLKAQWKANNYTVVLNAGFADPSSPKTINVTYDSIFKFPECSFNRPGYKFIGWADAQGKLHNPGDSFKWTYLESVTYTAQWKVDATAYIKFNGKQTIAMPYIKINGKYRLCQTFVKNNGVYKLTII